MTSISKVVCFDAFGTLLHMTKRTHPERVLKEYLRGEGVDVSSVALDLMARNKSWGEICQDKGVDPPPAIWADWQDRQKEEMATVVLYPETWDVLNWVASNGWAIGVVSNLGAPYDGFLRGLEQTLRAAHPSTPIVLALSFEVGAVKPSADIFDHVARQFPDLSPAQFYMTGDKRAEDCDGPRALGWNAVHLDRSHMTLWDSLQSLNLVPKRSAHVHL